LFLTYEELFDAEKNFSDEVAKKIGEFLGVDTGGTSKRPYLIKQAPESYLTFFKNKDELIRRFRGTKYEWMFAS
jgi:hypothetical protein